MKSLEEQKKIEVKKTLGNVANLFENPATTQTSLKERAAQLDKKAIDLEEWLRHSPPTWVGGAVNRLREVAAMLRDPLTNRKLEAEHLHELLALSDEDLFGKTKC